MANEFRGISEVGIEQSSGVDGFSVGGLFGGKSHQEPGADAHPLVGGFVEIAYAAFSGNPGDSHAGIDRFERDGGFYCPER